MRKVFAFALGIAILSPLAAFPITIETVTVGNPGNAGRIQGGIFGAVSTTYRIGTTEVTNAQYVTFLNAVAATDANSLYNPLMGSYSRGGILQTGSVGSYSYSVKPDVPDGGPGSTNYTYGDKPVNFVSWKDAARFANWMNNGGTAGASTETGAYTMANGDSVTRSGGATWFLPTENQWYKAAYYDGTSNVYYDYPTVTDSPPDNHIPANDTGDSANYYAGAFTQNESYPLTAAGAYTQSKSTYGTFDQGGNVWEWTETNSGGNRVRRGGAFDSDSSMLKADYRETRTPTFEGENLGFRMATIAGLPGDYNSNGIVDAADYVLWRKYLNQSFTLPNDSTAGTSQADYDVWRAHFGQPSGSGSGSLLQAAVPEPATLILLGAFAAATLLCSTPRPSSRLHFFRR